MYSSISPPLLKPLLILFEPSEVTLAPHGIRICDFWLFFVLTIGEGYLP